MPVYNQQFDYISAHLAFAARRPKFAPRGILLPNTTYLELLTEQYKLESFTGETIEQIRERKNRVAYECYRLDLVWDEATKKIEDSLRNPVDPEIVASFVTIGFNHEVFNPKRGLDLVKTILNLSIMLDGSFGVMEIHRKSGLHPHCHFKIYHSKKSTRGVLIQTISRASDAKKLISRENFIDVKPFYPNQHDKYLEGEKENAKMPYVEKDRIWRNKNGIPEKVFKDS